MAVLFLDPLVLGLVLAVLAYGWAVWRGWIAGWFGRDAWWTVAVWPLPALLLVVPVVGSGVVALVELLGVEAGDGGVGGAAVYTAAYLTPLVWLTVWPPRWVLPGWARRRLSRLPPSGSEAPADALPAVHGRRGHGSRATWTWQVDAVAGHVWLEAGRLRFRAVGSMDVAGATGAAGSAGAAGGVASATAELDDEAIAELRFSTDGDLRLEPPRGGWWSRSALDVDLAEVDRCHVHRAPPWRRSGRLTIEVEGRRSLHLWVGDVRRLAGRLRSTA